MRVHWRILVALSLMALIGASLAACGGSGDESKQEKTSSAVSNERETFEGAYVPKHHVEFNNFNKAQELYDTPSTIIWCTTTWGNPSAPMVTVPVAGKLTSSSVSYLPQNHINYDEHGNTVTESTSNDGMYHGSPPPYRYGFTPGGQYVDFFNMPTLCTTAMTKFQRQKTQISLEIDPTAEAATKQAEAALAAGTNPKTGKISPAASAKAQSILSGANLGE
jgi:hypothetical protein